MDINLKLSELLYFLIDKGIDHKQMENMDKPEIEIIGFSSIYDTKPNTLSWMSTQSLDWLTIKASVIICSVHAELPNNTNIVFIPVENPKNSFALVMREYCPKNSLTGISRTAIIGEDCVIGKNVYIGNYVVIGNNVTIGDHTRIHSNVTIHEHISIGCDCVIHSGVVIGTDGFGYEQDSDGTSFKIPHIGGSLTIEDNCWIAPGSIYKQGLTIGKNSLTGLGAVVIRNISPFDTVAGVPAKTIKKVESSE